MWNNIVKNRSQPKCLLIKELIVNKIGSIEIAQRTKSHALQQKIQIQNLNTAQNNPCTLGWKYPLSTKLGLAQPIKETNKQIKKAPKTNK